MPKAKAKTKTKPVVQQRPQVALTKPQQYYVKGNREILSEDQIAADLGLHVDDVRGYIATLEQNDSASRVNRLMQRPIAGVVAMTEAASMAADDNRQKGLVTQAEINRAAASGDHQLAADLARQREERLSDTITQYKARYSHCWHFIKPPEQGDRR